MKLIRAWIKSFFGFTRTETNGFLILLPLMVIILFAEPIYQAWFTRKPMNPTIHNNKLDSIVATWKFKAKDSIGNNKKEEVERFDFDPNTVSEDNLKRLGFSKQTANRIINYRTKGGKYFVKSDLKKIYGIDTVLLLSLNPFITLPDKLPTLKKFDESASSNSRIKEIKPFDINLADTSQLISLYGIGNKLSTRILKYRNRLGGFVSQDQYSEIFGLDSIVIQELKRATFIAPAFNPKKININQASEKELRAFPYFNYSMIKALLAYRFQHRKFSEIEEIQKASLIDAASFEKIKPYLTVKD